MPDQENIVGVDLGSTSIRVAVGQKTINEDSKLPRLSIIGLAEVESAGVNRGQVTSIDDAITAISAALDQAERIAGVPIESAWVSINGQQIGSKLSRGIVAVSKTNGEIGEDDVQRSIEASRTVQIPNNCEIIHVIPRSFLVDGQEGVRDPLGMKGMRLEVDSYVIYSSNIQVKNLTKCIYQTGLDIEDIVLAGLASAEATLTSKQKELGVLSVNIGSSTTSIVVFERGELLHTVVLPIGSEHITSDIAIGLRTSIEVAEGIKLRYGCASCEGVDKREEIDLSLLDANETGMVSKKYVYEIIEARVEEIFKKIDQELKKIERSGLLPGGVVISGGGAKLPKIVEVAKAILRLPGTLGYPLNFTSVVDKVNDLSSTTVLGLIKWGSDVSQLSTRSKFRSINKVTDRMKKWFKSLAP